MTNRLNYLKAIQEQITYLYREKHQPLLLATDEAQYLSTGILNDIKMLMNYGYDSVNYFTLILCRESHLNNTLRKPVHEALRQRITVHYNYAGLSDNEASKYISKAVYSDFISKAAPAAFKQSYNNLRSSPTESAAGSDTAQSERQYHRNQSAVDASHNVPLDTQAPPLKSFRRSPTQQNFFLCCFLNRFKFFHIHFKKIINTYDIIITVILINPTLHNELYLIVSIPTLQSNEINIS